MCIQKRSKILILSAIFAGLIGFTGCDAMDSFLSSSGTYKIDAQVSDAYLSDCSFITLNDEITPFFEESVSKDPDITSLIVSVRDWRVVYSLKRETEQYSGYSTRVIQVENFNNLPSFKIPADLPMGLYSIVYQIMSGKDIFQKTEKEFYFLGNAAFAYEGIYVHLPGITANQQLISRGQVVMLETKLDFDERLDPYVIWYNGKIKIAEGKYSEGAGFLLWKAPEQSNFYMIRAEVFPIKNIDTLSGYQKNISVNVSSAKADVHLVSENIPELKHWYVFEGNLHDSAAMSPVEHRSIKPVSNKRTEWMPANGAYGLATGADNVFMLPKVSISLNDTWQMLLRFKSINDGSVMSVDFGSSDVVMDLNINEGKLILTLSSPARKVFRAYNLPSNRDDFITMGVVIYSALGRISAKVNIIGKTIEQGDLALDPISVEANTDEFHVTLGYLLKQNDSEEIEKEEHSVPEVTVLWDELALYNKPPMEIIAQEIKSAALNLMSLYE